VIVNKAEGEYASAHNLRRGFGTRWAPRLKPVTLQLPMQHETIQTTMSYHVGLNADDVADELWRTHRQFLPTHSPTHQHLDTGGRGLAVSSKRHNSSNGQDS
jgi:integrase